MSKMFFAAFALLLTAPTVRGAHHQYPDTQPNAVEMAFYKWVMELNHAITLSSSGCVTALSQHYDSAGTLQLWVQGQPGGPPTNAAAAGQTLCGALQGVTRPSLGPMKIEVCGTKVRGYYGPMTDATG